jgi:lipoate-protein ligase A
VARGVVRGFPVVERRAGAGELVIAPEPTERLAAFCYPVEPAVVLGSTQPSGSIDEVAIAEFGAEVVRRRSGGGAVFVAPRAQVWLDLFVPVDDPLYDLDVSRSAGFVGELWREALAALDGASADLAVHAGPLVSSPWSRLWCFSGLGPGEVSVGGRKLVGVSQRRSRAGSWFFTMACIDLDPSRDASFLRGSPEFRNGLVAELTARQAPLESSLSDVESTLRASLARV